MAKSVTFTAAKYGTALTAFIAAAANADKTLAPCINKWAQLAAAGISSNVLTLASVREGIIAGHKGAKVLADCGNTAKGNFYAFQRIALADKLDELIAGKAFNTVARESAPKQEQKGKGKSGGKKGDKGKVLSLNDCIAGLVYHLEAAMTNTERCKELAANEKLAALVAKIGAVSTLASKGVTVKKRRPVTPRGKSTIATLVQPVSRAGSGKVVAVAKRTRKAA